MLGMEFTSPDLDFNIKEGRKMNSKFDGSLVSPFESDTTGVIKQVLTTYRVDDGMLRKETTQAVKMELTGMIQHNPAFGRGKNG